MKKVILSLAILFSFNAIAQEKKTEDGWKKNGKISFLANQSAFSNWVAGGQNTVAGTLGLNYDFNYTQGKLTWDNKIIASYGLSNISGTGTRKTDDLLDFNSLLGYKAEGYWSYSFFFNLRTQFTNGYDYANDPNATTPISEFFAPGYITMGPGMLWKKSDSFYINLSPATSKMTFVSNNLAGTFGTEPGETFLFQLGFYGNLYHKTKLMENVSMENILNVYTNYLEKPQNIDINYQLNFVMQINKYLSTNLSFHTIIDDDASKQVQLKEVFGLGVNYGF